MEKRTALCACVGAVEIWSVWLKYAQTQCALTLLVIPQPQSSTRGQGDVYKIYFILVHHSTGKVQISR